MYAETVWYEEKKCVYIHILLHSLYTYYNVMHTVYMYNIWVHVRQLYIVQSRVHTYLLCLMVQSTMFINMYTILILLKN